MLTKWFHSMKNNKSLLLFAFFNTCQESLIRIQSVTLIYRQFTLSQFLTFQKGPQTKTTIEICWTESKPAKMAPTPCGEVKTTEGLVCGIPGAKMAGKPSTKLVFFVNGKKVIDTFNKKRYLMQKYHEFAFFLRNTYCGLMGLTFIFLCYGM